MGLELRFPSSLALPRILEFIVPPTFAHVPAHLLEWDLRTTEGRPSSGTSWADPRPRPREADEASEAVPKMGLARVVRSAAGGGAEPGTARSPSRAGLARRG